ncbi:hypothetical protein SS50377_21910 [Spironucleus salmonicida]|uniref:Uncharacterized protein n=1 Tax=Spironucleus salmonicida TaxID=348837 RepID=V6LIM6_9EUKA|nr:hypothetical protein SS50377_21910 [Spironucleus salmonicida]|eukprot:EST44450.1 Hypothetical protein SS50377_15758 [Spironucleus salmonicida]
MSEQQAEVVVSPPQKKTLEQLAQEKKVIYLAEKEAKKLSAPQKQKIVKKEMKRSAITIISSSAAGVHIENLPKVTPQDVQDLIQASIGTKNVQVSRQGNKWSITSLNSQKQAQLVQKLNGSFCKESAKNLKVYIK